MKRVVRKLSLFHLLILIAIVATALAYYKIYFPEQNVQDSYPPIVVSVEGRAAANDLKAAMISQLIKMGFKETEDPNRFEGSYNRLPSMILSLEERSSRNEEESDTISIVHFWKDTSSPGTEHDYQKFSDAFRKWLREECENVKRKHPGADLLYPGWQLTR
jgi:hypothetical protein